jgi:hypothetical protein
MGRAGDERAALVERLRARQLEIEEAVLARILAISEPEGAAEEEYAHGLREAVAAAIGYGLDAVEAEDPSPPIPPVLLTQARLAARGSVDLDTVLRRYIAGYTLLGDYLVEEAEVERTLRGPAVQRLLRAQGARLDRVLNAVSEEYAREKRENLGSSEQRRADTVRRLLAGELLWGADLEYDFAGWHLGLIAAGARPEATLARAADTLDCGRLLVRHEEGTAWAWLGARRRFDVEELERLASRDWRPGVSVAIGEPAPGLSGWRRTHRQARAALPIVLSGSAGCIRYRDVALLASMLRDNLLVSSLRDIYLAPLEAERDGGQTARETLRAYFRTGRQVSSAAAALGVDRHTVTKRLRAIEERLGRPLDACGSEVEAALQLDDLGRPILQTTPGAAT